MKQYRLFHRVLEEYATVKAESAQEACQKVGWLIGDTWVREAIQGRYTSGWRNVTSREVKPRIAH